jgi:hypothetical protein
MFGRHYSDEKLLAHLDGEISGWECGRLDSHLRSCWLCRTRRATFERQIHQISELFTEEGYPDDGWTDRQINRFRRERSEYETAAAAGPVGTLPARFLHPLRWGAAFALVVGFVIFQWMRPDWNGNAAQVAVAATRFDDAAAKQALHQSFRVELVRESGPRSVKTGQLEVWSDPAEGRYSAYLRQGGQLVFAVWRPRPGEEHWHGVQPEEAPLRLTSLAAQPAPAWDWEDLVVRWLASQRWQPISIAGELSHFLSQDDVTLRAERFRVAGETFLRLVARRQTGGKSVSLTAEFAQADFRPKLLRLRVEDASGAAELRLVVDNIERGLQVRFADAVFEPDMHPEPRGPIAFHLPQRLATARREPAVSLATPALRELGWQAAERELAVLYALHRAGACLGEPVQVEAAADGLVKVTGLVDQEPRREALRKALEELDYVRFEVRTVAEVLAAQGEHGASSDPGPRGVVKGGKVLIEERLASYLGPRSKADLLRRIADLSNQATGATATLLAHAWAVRRLHVAYPPERIARLRPQSRWILEDILNDHLAAIRDEAGQVLQLLEPALGPPGVSASSETPDIGFDQAVNDLFQLATRTDRLCRGVFGLSQLDADEESQAASALIASLSRLRRDAAEVRLRAAAEFRKVAIHQDLRMARDKVLPNSKE